MKVLMSFLFAGMFIVFAILSLVLQVNAEDYAEKTYHKVSFFGFLILANIEFVLIHLNGMELKQELRQRT